MNDTETDDLLRSARVKVPLPSTLQADVWRRIEAAERDSISSAASRWIESLCSLFVRPVAAMAVVTLTVSAGLWLGAGEVNPKRDGKIAYVQSVSPFAQAHQHQDAK